MRIKIGKIGENVLKRSILNQIKTKRQEVLVGAGIGEDSAIVSLSEEEVFVISTDPITSTKIDIGELAVINAVNDIAASGGEPLGVMVSILLPEKTTESKLKVIMEQIEKQCELLNIQIMGGHTEATLAVNQPIVTITAVGKMKKTEMLQQNQIKAGQDVVISKWIGLEGSSIIAKEREEELLSKFPSYLVKEARSFANYLSVVPEAAVARKSGASVMHDVTEGGIFGALWEVAEKAGVGLEIDLKKIPVKQETIEICEFYELNPYEFLSGVALLMVIDRGYDLVVELEKNGIFATVIGKIVDGNSRKIVNGDEARFLEPTKVDEYLSLLNSSPIKIKKEDVIR